MVIAKAPGWIYVEWYHLLVSITTENVRKNDEENYYHSAVFYSGLKPFSAELTMLGQSTVIALI